MERAGYWFYRATAGALCLLPLPLIFRLGWALGTAAYFISGRYRGLVLHNLQIAFGAEKSSRELRALARRHFATLGANLFSSLKLARMSHEEIRRVVTVENPEALQTVPPGGFLVAISHLGNWELFAQLSPSLFPCPVGTIYQALGNQLIDAEIRQNRARLGLALFERKEGFTGATRFLRSGGAVGVLIDQHAGDGGLWCPFFGRLASTSTLAATLALRTKARVSTAAIYTDGVARWRCVFGHPLERSTDDPVSLTVRLNSELEAQIRVQPEDWFWVHNRWKLPRPKFLLSNYKRGVAPLPQKPLQPFRILIRASNWLGDAVMTVPAVRAIKRGRPDAHVTMLTPGKLADFWRAVPEVDAVLGFAPGESVFSVAKKIRDQFDVAIVFPNSLRTGLEVWLAKIPRRVGYPGHQRARLLNQVLRPKKRKADARLHPPRHQVHHYLALAEFVGAEIGEESKPASARSAAGQMMKGTRWKLGLCPGAEYGPAKRWYPGRYAEVMREVAGRSDCEWVLFGTAKDAPVGAEVSRDFPGTCQNLIGKTTLAELIAELRTCDLLLTNDTGTMHLAAHLGVPTVAIFGSTEPALTGPWGGSHDILRHHVPCSPCYLRECPLDFRCMKAVTVEEVVAAIMARIQI